MTNFWLWFESRQFRRLIPPEVLAVIPHLKEQAKKRTADYHQEPASINPIEKVADFPGNVSVWFVTAEEGVRRGLPAGQGYCFRKDGNVYVIYRIPMTGYDTIYHELTHAYDPKMNKGLSKFGVTANGWQNNATSHEVDAHIAGHVDEMKDRLAAAPPDKKQALVDDLKGWLRKDKGEDDFDNLPELLAGAPAYLMHMDPARWRKFVSSVYNELPT